MLAYLQPKVSDGHILLGRSPNIISYSSWSRWTGLFARWTSPWGCKIFLCVRRIRSLVIAIWQYGYKLLLCSELVSRSLLNRNDKSLGKSLRGSLRKPSIALVYSTWGETIVRFWIQHLGGGHQEYAEGLRRILQVGACGRRSPCRITL